MDRRTLVLVALCLILFVAYPFLLRLAGLDKYLGPSGKPPATTSRAPVDSAVIASRDTLAGLRSAVTPASGLRAGGAAVDTAAFTATGGPEQPERLITVETPLYRALFSTRGAKIVAVELKRYGAAHGPTMRDKGRRPRRGEDWSEADRVRLAGNPSFALDLGSGAARRGFDRATYDVADSLDAAGQVRMLRFSARSPEGAVVQQVYRIRPDDYAIDLEVEIRDVPLAWRVDDYTLTMRSWPLGNENDPLDEERSLKASSLVGTNHRHDPIGNMRKAPKSYQGSVSWAAVQTRYFVSSVAIERGSPREVIASLDPRPITEEERVRLGPEAKPVQETLVSSMVVSLPGAAEPKNRFLLYLGPNEYVRLSRLGHSLERIVDLGWTWIRPLSQLLLQMLNWLHGLVKNYGIAIILIATIVRLLLHPLGMMSIKSMRAMQRVQPEIERIREKYKKDPQMVNQAMMALYKEHKINPAGGCLPMLLQMPLFIALYSVLFNAIELRQAPFVAWMHDLSAPDLLFRVGPFPVRLMPIIMTLSGFIQQKMTPTDPRQATTFYLMNVMMLVFFYNLPSGLVLYWTVMNLLTALQQWLALREDHGPVPVASQVTRRAGSK